MKPPPLQPLQPLQPLHPLLQLSQRDMRSSVRGVLAAGVALMVAVLLTLGWLALHDREQLLDSLRERNELLARVFADRATRNVDGTALALATVAEGLARGLVLEGPELRTALSQTLVSLPFVRGVAVLDAQGQVLTSSEAGERGSVVDIKALGRLPAPGQDALGPFVRARRLADLMPRAALRKAPPGIGFMPLVRGGLLPNRQVIYVVALLNLDAFANFQQVTVNDERAASALLTYGGQLVAATAGVPRNPGDDASALPPYTDFLPSREQGHWVGNGLRAGAQIAAFRVSATRPLVALVEIDRGQALAGWLSGALRLLAGAVAALLLIAGLTLLAARSLRAREQARVELDLAQQQVARRERELRVTIASVQELIFRTDAGGAITFVNERWADTTDTPVEAAAGKLLWNLVLPTDRLAARALFAAADADADADIVTGGDTGARRLQTAILTPRGLRWFDLSVMPLQQDGLGVGFAGSAVDVTESRNAEHATREARIAAEEASQAKSEFIANISHELRTPLQSIIGYSELGQMRTREQAKLNAMFGDIHSAGQRMLNLVNDLLDVAKIESTVGTMNLERSDLRGLVRDVAGQLAPQLNARALQLDMALPDHPLRAKVDPMRFEQVLRNVLGNAIKFSPPGGRITVSGEQTDAGELHLAVSDNGPGIPPGELDRIFEAFVQSSLTKDGSGGTGLGLAICRKIVVAHGGRIDAENRPGGGAVFHILLPARGASETLPAPL